MGLQLLIVSHLSLVGAETRVSFSKSSLKATKRGGPLKREGRFVAALGSPGLITLVICYTFCECTVIGTVCM